jgi:hypothetical protein
MVYVVLRRRPEVRFIGSLASFIRKNFSLGHEALLG